MSATFEHRAELLGIYRELHDQPGLFIDAAARADLQQQARRLLDEAFQIAFIGRFSVGKSMLINRLFLGSDVLTVALKPTTARLMYIKYGDQPALWLTRAGADGTIERQALAAPGAEVETIKEAIKHHTTHLGAIQDDDTGNYQLDWPDGRFFRDGVQLVDTIGTEDIDDRFVDATYSAIRQSDAVVMILNMTAPLTESEQRFIDEHLGHTGKKVFLVVNKSDARSPEEQNEVLADLRQRFTRLYQHSEISAEARIFAVSAKTGAGLDELRERLMRFVVDERLTEILRGHYSGLTQRFGVWLLTCRQRLAEHQARKDGDERQLREAREKLQELSESLARQNDQLDDVREDLGLELKDGIQELRRQCEQKLREFRQSNLSEQTIRVELATRFRDESDRLASHLQRKARNILQRRIAVLTGTDPEQIEQLDKATGSGFRLAIAATGTVASGTAIVVGGNAVVGAALAAIGTQTALWTTITGGQLAATVSTFTGALAPWALPVVAVGILVAVATQKVIAHKKTKDRESFLGQASESLRQDSTLLERELRKQLDEYVSRIWEDTEKKVDREGQALERLIGQADLSALEEQMSALRVEETRLMNLYQRLETLVTKGK